jgi:hypothetical protein
MSRMVRDREQLAQRVLRVVGSVLEVIGEELRTIYAALVEEGEVLPDPVFRLELDLRLVKQRTLRLRQLHDEYRVRRAQSSGILKQRDRLAGKLHDRLAGLRKIVDGEYGSGGSAALLGITGRTRRKPEPLLAQTRAVLLHLRAEDDHPGRAREVGADGRSFDAAGWSARLERDFRRLDEANQLAVVAGQLVVQLRADRDRAIAAADEARRHVVNTAISCCKLVGRDDLAERVRRFSRQRGRPGPKPGARAAAAADGVA